MREESKEAIIMDYIIESSETWMIDSSGYYTSGIKNYLINDGIPESGADTIINNATKVLGYCPNPESDIEKKMTGIVIGKVQSGKTSNFIALTALAFDNGYSHVVVFGGTKKPLVSQNSERINEYFAAMNNVIVLNTTEHKAQLTEEIINQFIRMGKKVIIVALKSPTQINSIKDNVFSGDILSEKPTLIIDDEGDEASLNGLVKKGKKSSTYKAIEDLKESLKRHCFVSVTATPQANLLVSSMDVLSPEFGVLVDPGKGYCGLDVFHTPNSQYVVEIPKEETSLLDEGVPNSFYEALATFFIACGIFETRGRKPGDKLSMLIHPSQLKIDHQSVFKKTEKIIKQWRSLASNRDDIAYSSLKSMLLQAYDMYLSAGVQNLPAFQTVEDAAVKAIQFCGMHTVNGDSVPNGADRFYDFNIYVGGAMLGRGLTLKGLAVTYIIRTSKGASNADTVTQRARWFGYKTKYLDLCRIYAVKKIITEFRDIREHENDLWETVRDANLQGSRFKDIARIFSLSDNLHMTRSAVAETEKYAYKPWNVQRSFQINVEYAKSNIAIVNAYKKKYVEAIETLNIGGGAPYKRISSVPYAEVNKELLQKIIYPSGSKIDTGVFNKLDILFKRKELDAAVDVIWMRDGIYSEHEIDDGVIHEYMVGRRPDDYTKPAIYEGDRKHFVKDDRMQLQIHMIKDKHSDAVNPTIALYIPKLYIEKLTNLVIRA